MGQVVDSDSGLSVTIPDEVGLSSARLERINTVM